MRGNERNSKSQSNYDINVGNFLNAVERRLARQRREDNEDINIGRFFELAAANRSNINGLNVYEIRDRLNNGNRGFELVGDKTINGTKKKTYMRFKNINDFESYIEKID